MPDCTGAQGCGSGASAGPGDPARCADGIDNDNDGNRDCLDTDCEGDACGTGCVCMGGSRHENNCSDGVDNDMDNLRDCMDTDCSGAGSEVCNDGLDNNCNRAIDCNDPACASDPSCVNLPNGSACSSAAQCAGGACRLESSTGAPNGYCTNTGTCNRDNNGVSTGCSADSACVNDPTHGRFCRLKCTGSGGCRSGQACHDDGFDNTCVPLCNADTDCATANGAGIGCNLWSRKCETKNRGLAKTSASCSSDNQCESGYCESNSFIGIGRAWCVTACNKSTPVCATGEACGETNNDDNTGRCFRTCNGAADCSSPYTCRTPSGTTTNVCYCEPLGSGCTSAAECCSGVCNFVCFPG
jgi:hypothetical protein